nr:hypothetical protein Iba_chr02dCG1270 [Ipomoea batatas]
MRMNKKGQSNLAMLWLNASMLHFGVYQEPLIYNVVLGTGFRRSSRWWDWIDELLDTGLFHVDHLGI